MKRRRATRPSVRPQPTGQLLEGTFAWLKLEAKARSFAALRAFSLAAGPRITAWARGERLVGATLYVRCSSSSWTQHLGLMKAQLLERLHKTRGGASVGDLRFTVGPLDETVSWELPRPPATEAAPAVTVPDEVVGALDAVADSELRQGLLRLYERLQQRRPSPGSGV